MYQTADILFFYFAADWSNGRWERVEMEMVITSSFCQEIRKAISGSPSQQTAVSLVLLFLHEHAFCLALPLPGAGAAWMNRATSTFLSGGPAHLCSGSCFPMWKGSTARRLCTEKCYFEYNRGDRNNRKISHKSLGLGSFEILFVGLAVEGWQEL